MEQITKSNSLGEKGSERETVHVHAGILLFTPKLLYFLIVSFLHQEEDWGQVQTGAV